ncbi:MAG: cobalt-precorrin-6A reductase [Xenococcaceae cyanobacterium MO_167.B27]|nr:cobalt-precorrin-6A reductase [Xenococcaceae cyanobacterium MO_167.B27]
MNQPIWLIGGTKESVVIAHKISGFKVPLIVTVTTAEARNLYNSPVNTLVGCMGGKEIEQFCQEQRIAAIIDASHPFAVEISQNAIATATKLQIPYLRYERAKGSSSAQNSITVLDSFETLLQGDYLLGKRVLLTVGCKVLPLFKSFHDKCTLFTRVLPKLDSLQTALDAGFTSDRIIALRPPISPELETALWQQWNISVVVTKASGKPGGEDIKQQVANRLGITLIAIARPPVAYPQQTSCIEEVMTYILNKTS